MSAETRKLATVIAGLFGKHYIGDGAIPDKSLSDVCGTIERMIDVREEPLRESLAQVTAERDEARHNCAAFAGANERLKKECEALRERTHYGCRCGETSDVGDVLIDPRCANLNGDAENEGATRG